MKKYIFLALTAITALAFNACSNDDIEISRNTVITLKPSTITTAFKTQATASDLMSFTAGYKLRTRLLIYDTQGKLVEEQSQLLNNYNHDMRVEGLVLPDGNYKLIAIADAVNNSDEYWTLSGKESLDKLRIDYTKKNNNDGFVYAKGILGIGKQDISIPRDNDITVNMQPAGCLVTINYKNIHNSFNIIQYGTVTDWIPGYVSFDLTGNYTLAADRPVNIIMQPNYGYIDFFRTSNNEGVKDKATYYFAFPSSGGNNSFAIVYTQNEGTPKAKLVKTTTMTVGGEYQIDIDFSSASDIKDIQPTWTKTN